MPAIGLGMLALIAIFMVLYTQMPWWIDGSRLQKLDADEQANVLSSDRGDLMKIIAGAGGVVALLYTARRHSLDRAGQLTDRYSTAITQIASDRLEERVGGIYALERIMADSPRDHPTVVEVLTAFVREHAPLKRVQASAEKAAQEQPPNSLAGKVALPVDRLRRRRPAPPPPQPENLRPPSADVQAAMTVLARRPRRVEPFALNFRQTDLTLLSLPDNAFLANADFMNADLSWTGFRGADLSGAYLSFTNLTGAYLVDANLTNANLQQADMSKTFLSNAVLERASLLEARLTGTVLDGADLRGAIFGGGEVWEDEARSPDEIPLDETKALLNSYYKISAGQLAGAFLDAETRLDKGLADTAWVVARIADCDAFTGPLHMVPPTPEPTS